MDSDYFYAMRKIAISDIHGCYRSFSALLGQLNLSSEDELYLLGDFVDRGPGSKAVLDTIFEMREMGHTVYCLRGNHEQMLLDSLKNTQDFINWVDSWGGRQTLESFGANVAADIPRHYLAFFENLDWYFQVDDFILVHAGLDFYNNDPLKPSDDMIYLRNWYSHIDHDWLRGRIIIHGHTPTAKRRIQAMLDNLFRLPVLDIDGGCFAKHLPGMGHLCAFDLTNYQLFFQENIDDLSGYWSSR